MADLYTSLTRLKMAMNDGRLPPMTPVPLGDQDVIDPEFTIGHGALAEDEALGLRCPVRGCGDWFHHLGLHISRSHGGAKGRKRVLAKLSIPQTVRLVSRQYHARASERCSRMRAEQRIGRADQLGRARSMIVRRNSRRAAAQTIGMKNLLDSCPTQLSHKIIDLHHELGRTPSGREANVKYGQGFTTAVITVFGTWNNAIAQCGLEARRRVSKWTVERVLPGLQTYYEMHGTLPYVSTVKYGQQTPLLPCATSIMMAFGTSSWPEAMRRAAALLDIHGGKYGLPERTLAILRAS